MPRGRPRKNPVAVPAAASPPADSGAKEVNKTEAVIRALRTLGPEAKPKEIQEFALDEFGVDMPTSLISNYKSILGKRLAGESRLVRKPKDAAPPAVSKPRAAGGITLADLEAIKALVARVGSDQVAAVAQLLAK